MAHQKLSDAQAKVILLSWPARGEKLWSPPLGKGQWIRAQPAPKKVAANPVLSSPGATLFTTQPDGLWLYFGELAFCDAVAIEVCGTVQNLNDKRSRYIPSSHSLVVSISANWFSRIIKVGRGLQPNWQVAGTLSAAPADDVAIPVRHLRVLYSLPNSVYKKWIANHTPTGFEYFCPHSSLNSYKSQKMQSFLRQMSISSQFY